MLTNGKVATELLCEASQFCVGVMMYIQYSLNVQTTHCSPRERKTQRQDAEHLCVTGGGGVEDEWCPYIMGLVIGSPTSLKAFRHIAIPAVQ